jgi:Flp pilus assembly pilin Flp
MTGLAESFVRFLKDDDSGAAALEFTLVAIPLILVAFTVIQFMLMAQAVIVMKQAAYAAARSALVNACQPISISSASGNIFGAAADLLWNSCTPNPNEWETAARIALLPISASNDKSRARQGGCAYPEALITILKQGVRSGLTPTLKNKACYAFEPDNVAVGIKWETQIAGVTLTKGPPPITATVQFKLPILAPVRMIFSNGSRGDGTKYWQGEVKVTLL